MKSSDIPYVIQSFSEVENYFNYFKDRFSQTNLAAYGVLSNSGEAALAKHIDSIDKNIKSLFARCESDLNTDPKLIEACVDLSESIESLSVDAVGLHLFDTLEEYSSIHQGSSDISIFCAENLTSELKDSIDFLQKKISRLFTNLGLDQQSLMKKLIQLSHEI